MTIKEKTLLFWVLFIALALFAMVYLRAILLPFVAGAAIAYVLDPIASYLERLGLPRVVGSLLILIIFGILLFFLLVTVAPYLVRELRDFALACRCIWKICAR